jgi:mRNA-degrading endonuclease toxin of MazEF toxin-antitoxin module
MKSHPKGYKIYFADLNPSIGSEISKIRFALQGWEI